MKEKKHILFTNPFGPFLDYHRKYLWHFLEELFEWKGFPDTVDMRFFNDKLITDGWAPIVEYPGRGYICMDGAIYGLDWYYRSRMFRSTNPVLKSIRREISYLDNVVPGGAVVFYNTCDYRTPDGMADLVENYAYKLAQADVSTVVSLENSRATLVPAVSDKESGVRVTEALKDIYAGRPATIAYKNSFSGQPDFQMIPIKARDNLITTELTDTKRQILAEFLTRIGVNVVPVDKKERVLNAEANSNNQELSINGDIFLAPRKLGCEELNRTFGWNSSVDINYKAINDMLGGVFDESKGTNDDNNGVNA